MSKLIEDKILSYIKEKRIVKPKEIEKKFNLTQSSNRRYLIKLEEKGFIDREFGEIILREESSFKDQDLFQKISSNVETKKKIAQYASKLSCDYKTIFIDSGSVCYYLLEFIDRKTEIFTNSLTNATRALELGFVDVNIIGGTLKSETRSIVGFHDEIINGINFPISFMGVNAIDEEGNLYTPEKREAKAKYDIIRNSLLTIILAEKEKFNSKSTFNFRPKDKSVVIVSNSKIKQLKNNKETQIINIKE